MNDEWLELTVNTYPYLLNTRTGALRYTGDRAFGYACSMYGQDMMLLSPSGLDHVLIVDAQSGYERQVSAGGFFENGCVVSAASFLPNGDVCLVTRNKYADPSGNDYTMIVISDRYGTSMYRLGKASFDVDCIRATTDGYVVASNRTVSTQQPPYLVDTNSGSVRLLTCDYGLCQYTDSSSNYKLCLVQDVARDGKTFLVQDSNGCKVLFRPAGMENRYLTEGQSSDAYFPVTFLAWNGYDRMLLSTDMFFTLYVQ